MKKITCFLFLFFIMLGMCIFAYADPPDNACACVNKSWEEIHVDPTCVTDGYDGYKCSYCGTIVKTSPITAYGHNFSGSNPRVCCNAGCSEPNPVALTSFIYSFSSGPDLYTYMAPSSTTLISSATPNTATGYVNYSVSPEGVVGLGAGTDSTISNAALNASLYIHAIDAGSAILSIEVFDGCGYYKTLQCNITVSAESEITVSSIEVFPKSATVEPGQMITVSANVLPSGAPSTVSWYSNNPTVATVNEGVITGVAPGSATITVVSVSDPTAYENVEVIVPDIKVSSITLSQKAVTLKAGGNTTLEYEISPANAVNKTLKWETSDSSVAYVDSKGCIYGISNGVAVITAYSADKSVSDTCSVTVTSSTSPTWTPVSLYTIHYSPGYYSTGLEYEDTNYTGYLQYLRSALYTRTGYTQTGWSTDYYGTTLDYSLNEAYSKNTSVNLYPYWTVNPSTPLKLTLNYNSSLGTVYFNGKVFPTGHYWSINEGETLSFSVVPVSNYYASALKLAGRNTSIYNNAFTVSYSDMKATNQSATVSFTSIYGKPKTGDEANIALWIALGFLSMAGAGLTATYVYRKKYKA